MIKKRGIFLLILFFIFGIGCTDINNDKKIVISEREVTIAVDEVYILSVDLKGLTKEEIVIDAKPKAIVEIEGFDIKGINGGTVTVTAYYHDDNRIFDSITINVVVQPYIRFTQDELILLEGENSTLPIEYGNMNGFEEVSFLLSNDDIVAIEDNNVIAVGTGEVVLIAYYVFDESICSEIVIFVESFKSIEFSQEVLEMHVNEETTLPIVTQGITNLSKINFLIEDETVISLDDLKITALKPGEVKITAFLDENEYVQAEIMIFVTIPPYTVDDSEYWIERLKPKYDAEATILSPSEIFAYNQNIFNHYPLTKTVDLLNFPLTAFGDDVETKIKDYDNLIFDYSVFDYKGRSISLSEKLDIKNNRNIEAIPENINLRYGIITEFAAVRSFPTLYYAQSLSQDRFQETGLNVGEGVVVYHESNDGQWYFVQAMNYYGWVESEKIGLCSREQMIKFLNPTNFIVVTANIMTIDSQDVRMGQILPYKTVVDNEYVVTMPQRNKSGQLYLMDKLIAKDESINDGYLPYTLKNVLVQAFKMLNIPYSWGDAIIHGRDCSSTQNAIFSCFGFKMPRNTSNQRAIPDYGQPVSLFNENKIKTLRPGSLIFTSGHVMMYIGDDDFGNAYLYHNTTANHTNCCIVQPYKNSSARDKIIAYLKLY